MSQGSRRKDRVSIRIDVNVVNTGKLWLKHDSRDLSAEVLKLEGL
jgi:hypothetical protein